MMKKFRVGDRVHNVRKIAEELQHHGVVTAVLRDGWVDVCWNSSGIRRLAPCVQVVSAVQAEDLILDTPVDTSERQPEWEEVSARHYRSTWLKDGEENTVDLLQIGDEQEWVGRRNDQTVHTKLSGDIEDVQKRVGDYYKNMGYEQV